MSTVIKDLGAATAYGYAVEKGYTGTEAEFAELMASYATVGQTAVTAAQTATTKASEAATSAIIATNKASEATTAAQTASTKASEAVGCVETATQKATEATQSASQALSYKTDAESAKTASQTAQGLAESAKDSAVSAKTDAESARDDAESARDAVQSSAAQIATNASDITALKEDLSNYDGITEIAIISQDGKKFISPSGVITNASGNYHISVPIAVNTGDEIRFICTVAGTNIAVISLCDENTENIIPVMVGIDSSQHEYSYRVQTDGYIVFSYRYDLLYKLYILSPLSNIEIKEVADSNKTMLKEQCGTSKIEYLFDVGKKFITQQGTIGTAQGTFHISKPIPVHKGERAVFIATGPVNSSMISTCSSDSTNVVPKAISYLDGLEHTYEYDVEQNGYIILSYNYTARADLYLLTNRANEMILDRIESLVKSEGNLLNHRTLISGKAISTQGVISDNEQYAITTEIPVEANTAYSYRNIARFVYFTSGGERIGYTNPVSSIGTGTITTPNNASYMIAMVMRFNSEVERVYRSTEWQIVKGESLPEYQQQQLVVNGYRVADKVPITLSNVSAFRRWDKICFDKQPVVFASEESQALASTDLTTSAIIAYYDALMAENTDYITKSELGIASDGESTIYRYDFVTPSAVIASGSRPISTNEKTKIILISGVHPEFGGIYGLYNALREITNNPELEDIKNGVHFIVIPTVNPYGINTKNRKNANGVDIARNFEIDYRVGTDPSSSTYAGTSPLSEPESIIVDAVLSANRDAIIFASCHSFQLSETNNVMWGSCATMFTSNLAAKLATKMSVAWRNKYTEIIPQTLNTILGSVGISTESGSEGKQAAKYGIQGLTMETSDYFPLDSRETSLTAFAISRNSETYINFIKTALGLYESGDPKDLNMIGIC